MGDAMTTLLEAVRENPDEFLEKRFSDQAMTTAVLHLLGPAVQDCWSHSGEHCELVVDGDTVRFVTEIVDDVPLQRWDERLESLTPLPCKFHCVPAVSIAVARRCRVDFWSEGQMWRRTWEDGRRVEQVAIDGAKGYGFSWVPDPDWIGGAVDIRALSDELRMIAMRCPIAFVLRDGRTAEVVDISYPRGATDRARELRQP